MASIDLTIRDATPGDAEIIADFNSRLAFETEGMRLSPEVINRGVETLLADQSKGRYWVAQADSRVVGQIMVTYEWSDWRNGNLWWIQSVYVHPDWRRKGVFSALYQHVESLAAAEPDTIGLRLYVEENNTRAQRTYSALGMVKPRYLVMESLFSNGPANEEK